MIKTLTRTKTELPETIVYKNVEYHFASALERLATSAQHWGIKSLILRVKLKTKMYQKRSSINLNKRFYETYVYLPKEYIRLTKTLLR